MKRLLYPAFFLLGITAAAVFMVSSTKDESAAAPAPQVHQLLQHPHTRLLITDKDGITTILENTDEPE